MWKRTRGRADFSSWEHAVIYCIWINMALASEHTSGKESQMWKIDLGKDENLTYGQGGILNHWHMMFFAPYGTSPIGYPTGSK